MGVAGEAACGSAAKAGAKAEAPSINANAMLKAAMRGAVRDETMRRVIIVFLPDVVCGQHRSGCHAPAMLVRNVTDIARLIVSGDRRLPAAGLRAARLA
jgi:hypothetical protein